MGMHINGRELADWCGGTWDGPVPDALHGVSTDSRTVCPGNLYVALKGPRFDGHDFVVDAFDRGAAAAVVDRDWRPAGARTGAGCAVLRVVDTRDALARMATAYRRRVNPAVVGITGSVGKSTVKEMTAQILQNAGVVGYTRGNWNNDIGLPLSLLAMSPDARWGVFEAGMNHPGEISLLTRIMLPTIGVVTNVGPVHIEFFDSVEAIAEEKADLLRGLPPDGRAVLNRDGPYFERLHTAAPCPVVTTSSTAAADYEGRCDEAGVLTVRERATGEACQVVLTLPGEHNAANALQAIAAARCLGVDWESVRKGLAGLRMPPMRWQLGEARGVTVINDAYNANPLSMCASIGTFARYPAAGRKWLVLGDMLELGTCARVEHEAVGRYVAAGTWDGLVTVGPLAAAIGEAARDAGFSADRLYVCEDAAAAAARLVAVARPGDAVLLKASRGMRLEEVEKRFAGEPQRG